MLQAPVYQAKREDLPRLVQYWSQEGLAVLTGNAKIFQLAHSWIALLLTKGYQVNVIDCAVRFNVYRLIEEGRILSYDIHEILFTGKVRRAFTPYQILDVSNSILNSNLKQKTIYIMLAPAKQLFDGDVKEQEGYFLLDKLFTVFGRIQKKGIPFIVVESPKYKNKTFQILFPKLLELANTKWEYDARAIGKETYYRFQIESKNSLVKNIEYRLYTAEGGIHGKNSNGLFNSPTSNT